MKFKSHLYIAGVTIFSFLLMGVDSGHADDDWEGFTEPRHEILVAAPETGIVRQLQVSEGDNVAAGQLLGVLDDEILKASLAIAKKAKESLGEIQSAQTELALKSARLKRFQELRAARHASVEEVDHAQMERDMAEARMLSVMESQQLKELEFERVKVQIARRQIRSPIEGVVTQIHKDRGEFVSPADAVIFTVVQLNPLRATFSLPSSVAGTFEPGQKVGIYFETNHQHVSGTVAFVSPVIHAQSGTVKVKVDVPNANGRYQSGQRCRFVPSGPPQHLGQIGNLSH